MIREYIIKRLNSIGWDIKRYPSRDIRRRLLLLKHYEIDTVIDIGAHLGGYAQQLRKAGYKGKIISFEPQPDVFRQLEKLSKYDSRWEVHNLAIGAEQGGASINISKNSHSSSILEINQLHTESAPSSEYIGQADVEVETLDSFLEQSTIIGDRIYLKIDAQGYEDKILIGAENVLKKIKGIQLELSTQELYKGQKLYLNLINELIDRGFELHSLENGFFDAKSGMLLQFDGIFFKTPS